MACNRRKIRLIMKETLKRISEKYGIGFKDNDKKAIFYIHFNPGWEWHEESIMYWWEQKGDGRYNWWRDNIFDCKHHIVGPGYPSYAVHEQEPLTKDGLVAMIESDVARMANYYKQYEHRI